MIVTRGLGNRLSIVTSGLGIFDLTITVIKREIVRLNSFLTSNIRLNTFITHTFNLGSKL